MRLLGSAALAAGCASVPPPAGVSPGQLDPLAFRNTYVEDGALATVAVNIDATRRREKAGYVPLGIFIANNGEHPLTVDRESLTLLDDTGRRYPMATVEEVKSLGNLTLQDLRASGAFFDLISRRAVGRPFVESVFFPISVNEPGFRPRGLVADTIELSRSAWMADVIYFPHPEGPLLGRKYELWLKTGELEEPIFVRFAVY